ncbi:MAG: LamG-like jellyroll fold domain-containing protein, partial [Chloroflexota bacterium]
LETLETNLDQAITFADLSELLQWFNETGQITPRQKKGVIGLARNYYMGLYSARTNMVVDSDFGIINTSIAAESEYGLSYDGNPATDEPVLIIAAGGVSLMQAFFQHEGDLILDEVQEILFALGAIEEELDGGSDLFQQLALVGISGAKGFIKKTIKWYQSGGTNFYTNRKEIRSAYNYIGYTAVGLALINDVFLGGKSQALAVMSETFALTATLIDTVDTIYSYYAVTNAANQANSLSSASLALNNLNSLQQSTRIAALVGFIADVAVAATIFGFSAKNTPPGSMAFNTLLADFVANVIVAIIVAVIAATLIGAIILAVIALIDQAIAAICRWNGEQESAAVKTWVCGGIRGAFTAALRYVIYDQQVLVDFDRDDRVNIRISTPTLVEKSGTEGYVQGNVWHINALISTTLTLDKPRPGSVIDNSYTTAQLKQLMRRSTVEYRLYAAEATNFHKTLKKDQVDWGGDNSEAFTTTAIVTFTNAGLNQEPYLYLSEGFLFNAIECAGFVGANEDWTCFEDKMEDTIHIFLGDSFVTDILPNNLDGFVNTTLVERDSYRLSWDPRFPIQIDADGDGLRSRATGGPDPDDSTPDLDGDGLTDFWEIDNGFDPTSADGDNDGLFDYWEAFYLTNPHRADSDNDGLLDGEEFYHSQSKNPFEADTQPWTGGWDVAYTSQNTVRRTWVSADPLNYDGDADTISDKREQIYGYNPNLPSALNVLTLNSEVDRQVVKPADTVVYTATIKNELDGRYLNGLLQAELPIDVVNSTAVMSELAPLEAITMTGAINVPAVTVSTPTSLTVRAGVVVSSSLASDEEPPGPVFYLDQFDNGFNASAGQSQSDDSGYGHSVDCAGSGESFHCPTDEVSVIFDGFRFDEYDRISVTGGNSLKLGSNDNTFSMMLWLKPEDGYSPNDRHFDEFGRTILGQNFYNDPSTAFPSMTLQDRKIKIHFGHSNGLGYCEATSSSFVDMDVWQHIAVTFDGTQFTFYQNGILASTVSGENCVGQDLYPVSDFTIGHTNGMAAYFRRMIPRNAVFDEGYIWSNDNDIVINESYNFPSFNYYHANPNNQPEMIWYPGIGRIHENPNNSQFQVDYKLEQWAISGRDSLTFWVCNLDDSSDGAPHGCLDSDVNSDEPLYYKKGGKKEYEVSHPSTDATGEYIQKYNQGYKNNKWGGPLTYDLYNNAFKGSLDEIALYNIALSPNNVEDIYLASQRVAYLTFDEPPGQDSFADATAYNTVGTCSAPNCPDSGIPGRDNQALRFDGVNDYVEFPLPLDATANQFTAAAWFKVNNLNSERVILQQEDGTGTGRTWLRVLTDGQLQSFIGGSALNSGTDDLITPGQWHHAAVTTDGTNLSIYLDGALAAQTTRTVEAADGDLLIGAPKSLNNAFFAGLIDEVVVQRGGLNESGVQRLMLEAPILNLHLDENLNVTTFVDDTPFGNDATCSGNTCPATGTKGQVREAIVLDGQNDVLNADVSNTGLDVGNMTVAMWVRPDRVESSDQVLLDMDELRWYMPADSLRMALNVRMDGTVNSCNYTLNLNSGDNELRLNDWNHLLFTLDQDAAKSSGRFPVTLYLNGAEVAQTYTSNRGDPCENISDTPSFGENIGGDMDEVSIFGTALRGSEVKALYDYQVSWFDQSVSHPIIIDIDDPQISLAVGTDYLPLLDTLLAINALDVSSSIGKVEVTVTAPGGGSSTSDAMRSDDPTSDAWFFNFSPTVVGLYQIDLVATDSAGNTASSSSTINVDNTPPTATLDASFGSDIQQTTTMASLDGNNTLTLFGTLSDPGSPASGVATNTVVVDLLDWQNTSVLGYHTGLATQNDWQIGYPFEQVAYGSYDVRLSVEDGVGNAYTATLGTVMVDDLAPGIDFTWPNTLLTDTNAVLVGTASTIPYPHQSKRLVLHFEEANGATQFVDSTRESVIATCADCPTAGQAGRYGQAISFDGNNDFLTTLSAVNPISDTFTALVWFNLTDTNNTYTLLSQESGASWLSVLNSGAVNTTLGGGNLSSPEPVTAGQWHHAAVSYDGTTLSLYVDGTMVISDNRTLLSNENDWLVGADGGFANLFNGLLDELVIYDVALSADQIYHIANPLSTGVSAAQIRFRHLQDTDQGEEAGTWYSVNLDSAGQNFSTWSFDPPTDLEGSYKIDLKVSNALGNDNFAAHVWNGNIDLAAPRLTFELEELGQQFIRVRCYAYDFNIREDGWDCPAASKIAIPESADWFVDTFTDTVKITAYDSLLQNIQSTATSMTACDAFGHCATATITSPTTLAESISIITPTNTTVMTGIQPIEISGYARSHLYPETIQILVDGQSIYQEFHFPSDTERVWSTTWLPETPGVHTIEAVMTTWSGHQPIFDPVEHTVTITASNLNIAKTLTPTGLSVSDNLVYTIVVSNSGNLDANNVRITDTLPAELTGTDLDETINLAVGDVATYTIPATVNSAFINLINTAWVSDTWQRKSATAVDFRCDRFEVFTNADSGLGSLRHAIDNACDGALITFAGDMTIDLETTITVDGVNITIDGEDNEVIINGRPSSYYRRIFEVQAGSNLTVQNLVMERGAPAIDSLGTLNVFSSTFRFNGTRAINHNSNDPLVIRYSTFDTNFGLSNDFGGAVLIEGNGTADISHSLFRNNIVRSAGGAIYNNGATLTVQNSTFTGNKTNHIHSGGAGAIYLNSGAAEITHNTFTGNDTKAHSSMPAYTADIHHQANETLLLANNILANKVRGRHCSTAGNGAVTSINNLIEDGTCSAMFTDDPALDSLDAYGGSTNSFALYPSSPAIDAANPTYCPSDDQRNLPRPSGTACDLGAFEAQGYTFDFEGGNQSTAINSGFTNPLSLTLYHGQTTMPLDNKVSVIVSGPDSGASLSPTSQSRKLDNQGQYTTSLTANSILGTYPVTITIADSAFAATIVLTNTASDLAVTKTVDPAIPLAGQPVTYTITFVNQGDETATDVVISDSEPFQVDFHQIISQSDVVLNHYNQSSTAYFTTTSLAPGQGGVITISGSFGNSLPIAFFITNTVQIASATVDGNPANNQASAGGQAACYGASRLYVDATASGANHGLTWADAFPSLQDALYTAAQCGTATEIWVAAGIYYPDEASGGNSNNRQARFGLLDGVAIYGGFAGTETLLSQRNHTTNVTILSGDIRQNDFTVSGVVTDASRLNGDDNAYHVVFADDNDASAILDGFTVTAGQATLNASFGGLVHYYGGGIYVDGGSPTLRNLIISGNDANGLGGGMYAPHADLTLSNIIFVGNHSNVGGALYQKNGVTAMDTVRFQGNQANAGGAIYLTQHSLWMTNSLLTGNTATGGAIRNDRSTVSLFNVTVASNQAGNHTSAFYSDNAQAYTLNNVIVWNNGTDTDVTPFNGTETFVISDSIIQGGCPFDAICNNVIDSDPHFVIAPDPTSAPSQDGDFRLLPGSAAIDAGTNINAPSTDIQGLSRPINGTVDAGAHESRGFTATYNNGNAQTTFIGNTFVTPLQITISSNGSEPVGPGGAVTFAGPDIGASLLGHPVTGQTDASGVVQLPVTANTVAGSYVVTASASGVSNQVTFALTNTQADLLFNMTVDPASATPGETVTYTLIFTNDGLSAISGVVITDFIPTGLTIQQVMSQSDVTVTHANSTATAETFTLAPLSPGDSGVITLTGQIASPLALDLLQNTATITSPVLIGGAIQQVVVNLKISNVSPTVTATTFTVNENAANDTLVGTVTGSDINDDKLTYSIIGGNDSQAFRMDAVSGEIFVDNGLLLDFESQNSYPLIIQADDGELTGTNTITVSLLNIDTDLVLHKTALSDLAAQHDAAVDYLATPSGVMTYTLAFTNVGADTATGVVITDSLPSEFTLLSSQFWVTNSGLVTQTSASPLAFAVSDLPLGYGGVITLTGQVDAGLAVGIFTNTAIITSAIPELN